MSFWFSLKEEEDMKTSVEKNPSKTYNTIVNTMIKKEKHCKVKTQYKFTKHHIVKLKILTGALFFCNFQCILYISKTATFIIQNTKIYLEVNICLKRRNKQLFKDTE